MEALRYLAGEKLCIPDFRRRISFLIRLLSLPVCPLTLLFSCARRIR
jgi:hypothetical protein